MYQRFFSRFFLLFAFLGPVITLAQPAYELVKTPQVCEKGAVTLSVSGAGPTATTNISWSTGQTQLTSLSGLDAGDYSVNIHIQQMDTILHQHDTTLYFTIGKEQCPVPISRQFTPNGDGYNDELYIGNVHNYPNFEFEVFNKWGQRVYHQKSTYTPWDGKWAGTNVPDGTYYYMFFYDSGNKSKFLKGDITLLR